MKNAGGTALENVSTNSRMRDRGVWCARWAVGSYPILPNWTKFGEIEIKKHFLTTN